MDSSDIGYQNSQGYGTIYMLPRSGVVYYLNDLKTVYSYTDENPVSCVSLQTPIQMAKSETKFSIESKNGLYYILFKSRYATAVSRLLHREDGPAIETDERYRLEDKRYFIFGKLINNDWQASEDDKWLLLKGNPENIQAISGLNLEMQEYVIQQRPDLIGSIKGLDPVLKSRYKYELEMAKVDI